MISLGPGGRTMRFDAHTDSEPCHEPSVLGDGDRLHVARLRESGRASNLGPWRRRPAIRDTTVRIEQRIDPACHKQWLISITLPMVVTLNPLNLGGHCMWSRRSPIPIRVTNGRSLATRIGYP